MGYRALVTISLPGSSDEKREAFYRRLEEEQWLKIYDLTDAWEISFKDNGSREQVIMTIQNDIRKAQQSSSISTVHYAIQVGREEIEVGTI